MKKLLLLAGLLPALGGFCFAQNEEDVLRYSFQKLYGSSRVMGMGGTSIATGGDITSAFSNPAGLAVFRENQYQIGLGFSHLNTRSEYIDDVSKANKTGINIPHMGMVFTQFNLDKGQERKTGLVSYNFSIALNRNNSFNRRVNMTGSNPSSSMMDYFAERSYGYDATALSNDFNSLPGQAWNAYLINEDPQNPYSYMANLPDSILMHQKGEIVTSGRINDLNVGLALNFSNKLYFGFSVAMSTIRHENKTVWEEETGSIYTTPRSFKYELGYTVSGTAFTGRIGAILRFNDYVRAGLSYQTGSRYTLTDNYYNNMSSSEFKSAGSTVAYNSEVQFYNYRLRTPSRIAGGFAFFLPKRAVLNVELENVNYSLGWLSATDYSFSNENRNVKDLYQSAFNFKTGMEILYGPMRFRAGYAHFGSPVKKEYSAGISQAFSNYTLGVGFKNRYGFFMDMAMVYQHFKDFYTPYALTNSTRTSYTALNNSQGLLVNVSFGASF